MPMIGKLLFQVQQRLHQGLKQGRCLRLDPLEHNDAPGNSWSDLIISSGNCDLILKAGQIIGNFCYFTLMLLLHNCYRTFTGLTWDGVITSLSSYISLPLNWLEFVLVFGSLL